MFTAVSTKVAVLWVVAPCSLVEVYQRFRGPCCLNHQGYDDGPDNGGSKDLWKVGKLLPDYTRAATHKIAIFVIVCSTQK
jgi:hypothetical protein